MAYENLDDDMTVENTVGHFKKDPEINVISKEEFEERVEKVFHLLWKTLSKSFGPYGAPTLIYRYPFSHVTKDGYTIMKNLSMNAAETKVDEAIKGMAADICGRLNYSVGDGTTSAIIATNSIYSNYIKKRDKLNSKFILPRDVIHKYNNIKDEILKELATKVVPIQSDDPDVLWKNIYDVVYISSNGDETYTNYIADLYRELMAPSITCKLAPDGITKKTLVTGYKYNLSLNDRLYINNDDNTMSVRDADVIVLGTRVNSSTYNNILKPLNQACKMRGRNLIVCAPSYDENTLEQVIKTEFNNEYRSSHKINMVLTTYRAISAHTRKLVNDFATLMNTIVIDRAMEENIINMLSAGNSIDSVFNIDGRDIEGLRCIAVSDSQNVIYSKGVDNLPEEFAALSDVVNLVDNYVDLGYVKQCSLGLNESLFTDMIYDEEKYNALLKEAEDELNEKEEKYKKLGSFNVEVSQAQERLYALKLKMGIIEVGADSELSQNLLKDAVDDAIKAAASAFKYGVVYGCNLNLIQVIRDIYEKSTDDTDKILIDILFRGFVDVYGTVLSNAFDDEWLDMSKYDSYVKVVKEFIDSRIGNSDEIFEDEKALYDACDLCVSFTGTLMIHKVLIFYSMITNKVLDISKFRYSSEIVNSVQTDEEILKATIDLISLLIVGNQMVVTMKDY